MSTKSLSDLIAERAYEVYQRRERSGAPGDQHSDWAQAEKEVTEELKKKGSAQVKAPESKPVPVSAPKVEIKPVAKPEVKEPPKPAPKAEEKVAPKVEPKPVVSAPSVSSVSSVKTVVAKKAVKK